MKKQIVFLIFVLFMLSINKAYSQDPKITPTEINCIDLDDPLRPVAGKEYTYEVDVPTPPGAKEYHWFVTQEIQIMETGSLTSIRESLGGSILASGDAHYNVQTADENSINLTWQSFTLDPDEYVFVVVYVENTDDCTTNNLKVYRILPVHAFTLDIANLTSDGTANANPLHEQCVGDVQSALFDPTHGTDGGIIYDFGENTLVFIVAAANFSGQYLLEAQFTGLNAATPDGLIGQSATLYWGYSVATIEDNGPITVTEGTTLDLGLVEAQGDTVVGKAGEMIYIKVVIEHHSFENTANTTYSLAVNGRLADSAGQRLAADDSLDDIHHEAVAPSTSCAPDLFVNDIAEQVLTPRPGITPVSPTPFLPITD